MSTSKIEWTEQTWNPVTGCTKISPGCKHCYAERMALRLQAMNAPGYARGFELTLHADRLDQPLRRKKPTIYFICSMADLFHEDIPDEVIDRVFAVAALAQQHTCMILTKRPERMNQWFEKGDGLEARHDCVAWQAERIGKVVYDQRGSDPWKYHPPCDDLSNRRVWPGWPLPNVWLGVTVEDRRYGLPRIEHLRQVPARVRFLSVEPLLEDLGPLDLSGIHWVIVGGESGPDARPMREEWALSVRDQCQAAGVAFLFKQWGGWGADGVRRAKHANGRLLAGRTWNAYPEPR